ncbi:MAG: hypothetical protein ACLTDR_05595 [Adlercreutzia equolifaciens]
MGLKIPLFFVIVQSCWPPRPCVFAYTQGYGYPNGADGDPGAVQRPGPVRHDGRCSPPMWTKMPSRPCSIRW